MLITSFLINQVLPNVLANVLVGTSKAGAVINGIKNWSNARQQKKSYLKNVDEAERRMENAGISVEFLQAFVRDLTDSDKVFTCKRAKNIDARRQDKVRKYNSKVLDGIIGEFYLQLTSITEEDVREFCRISKTFCGAENAGSPDVELLVAFIFDAVNKDIPELLYSQLSVEDKKLIKVMAYVVKQNADTSTVNNLQLDDERFDRTVEQLEKIFAEITEVKNGIKIFNYNVQSFSKRYEEDCSVSSEERLKIYKTCEENNRLLRKLCDNNGTVTNSVRINACSKMRERIARLTQLAEQNDTSAIFELAECFYYGFGVEENREKAFELYLKSAEQGNSEAQCNVGCCYYYGEGVKKNVLDAIEWFRRSAEQGNDEGQFWLGRCYDLGEGVEQDDSRAIYMYKKSVEQSNCKAMNNLANCYYRSEILENFVGKIENLKVAIEFYIMSAQKGNAVAQRNLGCIYYYGDGVKQDYAQAVKWLRRSADQGNSYAQYDLGVCYYLGNGVDKDYAIAVDLFRKSAEQGNSYGQWRLGDCYYYGLGVEQDYYKAIKLYKLSADQGNSFGQLRMGDCFYYAHGVERDIEEAVRWYKRSAEQGNTYAKETLDFSYLDTVEKENIKGEDVNRFYFEEKKYQEKEDMNCYFYNTQSTENFDHSM